jgi:hypothetical protein
MHSSALCYSIRFGSRAAAVSPFRTNEIYTETNVDSRSKIKPVDELRHEGAIVVVGYFDPLYAVHVRRLLELASTGKLLTVVVADSPAPLLSLRARAELVAGLACVHGVIEAPAEVDTLMSRLDVEDVIDERSGDEARARQLTAQVLARCRTG